PTWTIICAAYSSLAQWSSSSSFPVGYPAGMRRPHGQSPHGLQAAPPSRRLGLQAVARQQELLRLAFDVRDDVDVGLEPGAAELGAEQLVDLIDAGGVVHRDLDPDRALDTVGDRDVVDRGRRERVDGDAAAPERDPRTA